MRTLNIYYNCNPYIEEATKMTGYVKWRHKKKKFEKRPNQNSINDN